jgi:hypothetical protein
MKRNGTSHGNGDLGEVLNKMLQSPKKDISSETQSKGSFCTAICS